MDIEELRRAAAAAASPAELDQLASYAITLNANGIVDDETAQALLDLIEARRKAKRPIQRVQRAAARQAERLGTVIRSSARPSSCKGRGGREKQFGHSGAPALDRNERVRIMTRARALARRTDPGRHYGAITGKCLAVLEALLWRFHNAKDGRTFPSYEAIAEAAACARSTVGRAIVMLEEAGLLTWRNSLVRVRRRCRDLLGGDGTTVHVHRTSNTYFFPKSDLQSRTENPDSNLPMLLRLRTVMDGQEERGQGSAFTGSAPRTARNGPETPDQEPWATYPA